MRFLLDVFQMIAFAFVSVINHYHINGLHVFYDTLFLTNFSQWAEYDTMPIFNLEYSFS